MYFIDLHRNSWYFIVLQVISSLFYSVLSLKMCLVVDNKYDKPKRIQSVKNYSDSTGILHDSEWMYHDLSYGFQLSGCYHVYHETRATWFDVSWVADQRSWDSARIFVTGLLWLNEQDQHVPT